MRMISCHVTGFGRLVDYDHDFEQGFNTIFHNNSWGKSTFALFIKAMFYGLEPDTKGKAKADKKRVRYEPWDGAPFGGSLTFEYNDKIYRVERTFANKAKDDTLHIYDLATNMEVDDFNPKDSEDMKSLGDIIFGVDEESFMKSIFVSQNDLAATMTPKLSAKMGNISTAKADISNFKEAENRLDKKIRSYYTKKVRKDENKGRYNLLEGEVKRIDELLENRPEIARELHDTETKRAECLAALEAVHKEKEIISAKIQKQSEHKEAAGVYKTKKSDLEELSERLKQLDDFFVNGIPSLEELDVIDEKENELLVLERELDATLENMPDEESINLWKELFTEDISEQQFDEWDQKSIEIKELRARARNATLSDADRAELQGDKFYFAKKHPTHEEISLVNEEATNVAARRAEYDSLSKLYEDKRHVYDDQLRSMSDIKPLPFIISMVMAVLIVIIGIAGLVFLPGTAGLSVFAAGIGLGVVIIIGATLIRNRRIKSQNDSLNQMESEVDELRSRYERAKTDYETSEKIVNDFLSNFGVDRSDTIQQNLLDITTRLNRYDYLLAQEEEAMVDGGEVLEMISAAATELYYQLDHYADIYDMNLHEDQNEAELLVRLKDDYRQHVNYIAADKARTETIQASDIIKKEITSFITQFPTIDADTRAKKLREIRRKVSEVEEASKKVEELKEELASLEDNNSDLVEEVSVEELQEMEKQLDITIEELHEKSSSLKNNYASLSEEMYEFEKKEVEKEILLEEMKVVWEQYTLAEETLSYLKKAKEKFQSKYIKPLQDGMRNYVDLLLEEDSKVFNVKDVSLDMDLNVIINYNGSTKKSDSFSPGIKDMISLCSRFALVDVLYEDDTPFMILDDPFVNLDADKIDEALKLLKELSKDRQIIYFTCHRSRT